MFHIAIAKEYFNAYKDSLKATVKHQAKMWVGKLEFLHSDVYSAMTPESRETFIKEIKNNDVLAYEEIFRLTLMMDNEQRELFERLGTAILKGEMIEYTEASK